jgi:hypothetical protein
MTKRGQPSDDTWSAPESGTVRDDTTGNASSDLGDNTRRSQASNGRDKQRPEKPDTANANEER